MKSEIITAGEISSPLVKTRDSWYDNAKAFLIVCVVIGHLANGIFSTSTDWVVALQKFIYVYHMPVFMIITGRFAKSRIDRNDWPAVINKVIVPYIVLQTAMAVFYSALGKSVSGFSYFNPLFGLWYLLNAGVYSLITPHLKKIKWLLPVSFVVAIVVGCSMGRPFGAFYRLFTFYPFFLFGYYTKNFDFSFCKKIPFRIFSYACFIVMGLYVLKHQRDVSFELMCINKLWSFISEDMGWSAAETAINIVLRYAVGIFSFFMVMGMMPTKKQFFSYIGTNSSYVYVLHLFLIVALREIDENNDILRILTDKWRLLIYCFSGVPIAFILASKPVRKLTRFLVEPNFDLKRLIERIKL